MDENLSEKQVQELAADFPWLLNINYERIPRLDNKGMEFPVSDNKRIDLILRDKITNRPVIVEFKAVPFYRENIGQILEYRARILSELSIETSLLKDIFENLIASPILILIVPSCMPEARIACNLSGVEIYEYEKELSHFILPEKQISLAEFDRSMKDTVLPISKDRDVIIRKIESELINLLYELGMPDAIKKYRIPKGAYWDALPNLFLNKWLFSENPISIGVYEDIFNDKYFDSVVIEIYSNDEMRLKEFIKRVRNEMPDFKGEAGSEKGEHFYSVYFDKMSFLDDPRKIIKPIISTYQKLLGDENCYRGMD
jgi:hypothetical protein